jgi:hypothetical protein
VTPTILSPDRSCVQDQLALLFEVMRAVFPPLGPISPKLAVKVARPHSS